MALLETNALTLRYSDRVTALAGLSVRVEPGIIGLVGANGAGKSTLLKILLGLLHPSAGQVRVLGLDPVSEGERVRAAVGYMPEHDCLPPDLSAAELVTHLGRVAGLPKAVARERASEALRHVGLYEERYRQIGGYSTGMRQRVKLAQALVHDPDLLLLDEPTNGLDPAGRDGMLELVHRIGTEFGISIVVCSHLLGEVERICTSLVAIDGGRLLRAADIASFTSARDQITVEIAAGLDDSGTGPAELATRIAQAGLAVTRNGQTLLITLPGAASTAGEEDSAPDAAHEAIIASIADLGLPLHRLERRRHHITELFAQEEASRGSR